MKKKLLLIITAATQLFFPNLNFGQAPNLGTASSFALFTAAGAFSNTMATTYVTGDVGTNVGAFTAFPPGTVVGAIHLTDATSAQAATDVAVAYSDLFGRTCGTVLGVTLGSGQVLTPDVYCTGAASTLAGDLYLDAQGDPNALFIFQVNGAFAAGTFSKVILINSASLYNVYWQINGQFDLGDGSVFRGTLVTNGPINLLGTSSLLGRGLSKAGAISLIDNIVNVVQPLPIELVSFTAHQSNVNVQLNWSTATEINNDYYTVHRSQNGISFEKSLQVQGEGNSSSLLYYSAIDYNPYDGTAYYRLMQTDFDGRFTYSDLVSVDFDRNLSNYYKISPNPFSTSIDIAIKEENSTINFQFIMYNILGKAVVNTIVMKQTNTIETTDLISGIYFYKLVCNHKIIQSGKLISKQ